MPKTINVSDEQRDWLAQNYGRITIVEIAQTLGCHVDTAKRILAREGLADFPGAKYVPKPPPPTMWTRPCINCKSTERRPRLHFMCSRCRRAAGYSD